MSPLNTTERGLLGAMASIGSAGVSLMQQIEIYLRVAGLVVGLAVGVVTLISVIGDLRAKKKKEEKK